MKKHLSILFLGICFLCGCAKAAKSDNSYFFPQDVTSCTYEGTAFWEPSAQPAEIVLSITKVQSFGEGDLYALEINHGENAEDRFGVDRSRLGSFLVQEDKIYFLDSACAKGESLTAEAVINTGKLVCNEAGTMDVLDENEGGWHEYILVDGNKREYHGYNNLTETGYYECFIWELGKGLVEYRSGYGAEADAISLSRRVVR